MHEHTTTLSALPLPICAYVLSNPSGQKIPSNPNPSAPLRPHACTYTHTHTCTHALMHAQMHARMQHGSMGTRSKNTFFHRSLTMVPSVLPENMCTAGPAVPTKPMPSPTDRIRPTKAKPTSFTVGIGRAGIEAWGHISHSLTIPHPLSWALPSLFLLQAGLFLLISESVLA